MIYVGLSLRPLVQGRGPRAAQQGVDLVYPRQRQGCRRLLVRRLLRRSCLHREQGPRGHHAPTTWADLKKPEYANQFALAGDPRVANQAIQSVYASGLRAAPPAPMPALIGGLAFFGELNKARQLRAGDRQGGPRRAGHDAHRRRLGLQLLWRQRRLWAIPLSSPSSRRRAWSRACTCRRSPPTPRIRCGKAVDGTSVFGRRPARLARRLLPPDPLQDMVQRGRFPPISSTSCHRPILRGALFPSLDEQGKAEIIANWDAVVGADIPVARSLWTPRFEQSKRGVLV